MFMFLKSCNPKIYSLKKHKKVSNQQIYFVFEQRQVTINKKYELRLSWPEVGLNWDGSELVELGLSWA